MVRRKARWLSGGIAASLIGAVVIITQPAAAVDLPDRPAHEVLAMIAERQVDGFAGTFAQTSDLGLPELPGGVAPDDGRVPGPAETDEGIGPGAAAGELAGVLAMLTGSHEGRVLVGGPGTARLQLMDSFAERNLIVNGSEVWLYDSGDNAATHLTLPEGSTGPERGLPGGPARPDQLVDQVLAAIEPSTEVTVGQDATVAGHDAYELVLTPRSTETLVAAVAIAVDGETGLPLSMTVRARGQEEPAFHVGYTSLSYAEPDASLFEFTPPPGATVTEKTVTPHAADHARPEGTAASGPEPRVVGTGWETVVILPAGSVPASGAPLLDELTSAVDGGRLLSTALVNVLVTEDGGVLLGAVPSERLQTIAGS